MRTAVKVSIIVAVSLISAGILIFTGVLAIMNWNFSGFFTTKYETNTHEINESFESIEINSLVADISLLPSTDASCRVVCHESPRLYHSVKVVDNTLKIDIVNERKWYDHINFGISSNPTLTVYIPEGEYRSLSIESSTGDVGIPAEFSFGDVTVTLSTGDVKCYADVSNSLSITASTGHIDVDSVKTASMTLKTSTGDIRVNSAECSQEVSISVTTGKTYVSGLTCGKLISTGDTGDMILNNVIAAESLSIERSTGDVTLEACDAAEIFVTTDTGDVTGTLCSEKVFITNTDTGKINVPNSITGGRCEITTDTGDIIISVE